MENTTATSAPATEEKPRFDLVKDGAIVLFLAKYIHEEGLNVESGNVIYVQNGIVGLVWLEGHSSRNEDIKMEDLLSVADKQAPHMEIFPFHGRGYLLPAGKAYLEKNPNPEK
jgi:hypothetical protein